MVPIYTRISRARNESASIVNFGTMVDRAVTPRTVDETVGGCIENLNLGPRASAETRARAKGDVSSEIARRMIPGQFMKGWSAG